MAGPACMAGPLCLCLPCHRQIHIQALLITELKRIASEKDAYVIFVQADSGDMPATRLYESLGTRKDVHHFDIGVDK